MTEDLLPPISVVIATFNSARTLESCLKSLREQNYPADKIQLVVADGGSTDQTLEMARTHRAMIVNVPKDRQDAEYNKGFGLQYATGELVLFIDHDNVLPHKDWLRKMLRPLLEHQDLVASEPLRYHFDPSLSMLDRYFALFGVNDPLPYYLGKADRMDYIHDHYNLLGKASDEGEYYVVTFDQTHPARLPTLGANGFLIRTLFLKQAQHEPGKYFHIDINVDLVGQGHVKYAFIKDDIIHLSNSRLSSFLKRRKQFMEQYYMRNLSVRRYSVYRSEDLGRLLLFIFYAATVLKPLFDSFRGWLRVRNSAWFIHPLMCLAALYIYGLTTLKGLFKKR